jgi:hypothetical protein
MLSSQTQGTDRLDTTPLRKGTHQSVIYGENVRAQLIRQIGKALIAKGADVSLILLSVRQLEGAEEAATNPYEL